jgi:prepilin-type N-terminal cleavage/methylation domain-containing protein
MSGSFKRISFRKAKGGRKRKGVTIIELLVVVVIIAGLAAILFPAVQNARATARRSTSQSNLRQIALAILNYEVQNGKLPVAERVAGKPRLGWVTNILPQLERRDLYDRYDFQKDWFDPANLPVTSTRISVLIDPSSPNADRLDGKPEDFNITSTGAAVAVTDYASIRQVDQRLFDGPGGTPVGNSDPGQGGENPGGNGIAAVTKLKTGGTYASGLTLGKFVNAHGVGIMPPNATARLAEVRDGLSTTILLAESHGRPFLYRRGKQISNDTAVARVNGGGWSRNANDIRLQGFNQDGTEQIGPYAINVANGVDVVTGGSQGQAPGYGTDGSGAIYSFHAGGAHLAFGDASVRFVSEKIDIAVLAALVTRDQNELYDEKLVDVK